MFLVWTLNSIGWWFDNYNADDYLLTDISSICLWSYLNGWRGGITETLVDLIATVYHVYKVYRVFFFLKKKKLKKKKKTPFPHIFFSNLRHCMHLDRTIPSIKFNVGLLIDVNWLISEFRSAFTSFSSRRYFLVDAH